MILIFSEGPFTFFIAGDKGFFSTGLFCYWGIICIGLGGGGWTGTILAENVSSSSIWSLSSESDSFTYFCVGFCVCSFLFCS